MYWFAQTINEIRALSFKPLEGSLYAKLYATLKPIRLTRNRPPDKLLNILLTQCPDYIGLVTLNVEGLIF